ncbi:MAG: SAM-dependent methyltransferase [Proteobacteria bacterium]|nr:SAM-dependent methyltransferase [Pseudomonadota bacterium]
MKYYKIKKSLLITIPVFFILSFVSFGVQAENTLAPGTVSSPDNKVKADLRHHKQEVAERLPVIGSRGVQGESNTTFSITGIVQNPIWLTTKNLSQFKQVTVFKTMKGKTRKPDQYTGTPIRTLLEIVKIQKNEKDKLASKNKKPGNYDNAEKETNIKNNSDIAVSIKNKDGKQIIFSLDYILQGSENEIILVNNKTNRLPELVMKTGSKDIFSSKDIISIEVMQFFVKQDENKDDKLQYITYVENKAKISLLEALAKCETIKVPSKNIKALSAKTSTNLYTGCSLYEALSKLSVKAEYTDIFTAISDDGYSASFSFTELENSNSPVIIIQNRNNSQYSYDLVVTGDSSKARWVKNISQIKQVKLKQKPMIYVIGMGCGDISLLTNEAISYMGKADVFICMEKYKHSFAGYMSGKPVLFDPFLQLATFYRKNHPELSAEEAEKMAKDIYNRDMQMIRDALNSGKIVALLEPGDPTIYGGWRNWLSPNFPNDKVEIIPGISSFAAANAMLGKYDITETSVIITEPETLKYDESLIKSAAETESTMVIFMGISRMNDLAPVFAKYYAKDTPVHLVFYAGITGNKIKIKTTLEKVVKDISANKENFLGLIYIGSKLR